MKLTVSLLWTESGTVLHAFPFFSLLFSHTLSLWFTIVIVVEIYSEISLLTSAALVLNEWPVKLMGQIQSFLVTHSSSHTCTHSHARLPFISFSDTHICKQARAILSLYYNAEQHRQHSVSFIWVLITVVINLPEWASHAPKVTLAIVSLKAKTKMLWRWGGVTPKPLHTHTGDFSNGTWLDLFSGPCGRTRRTTDC